MKIRLIHGVKGDLENEQIAFTEDFETQAGDFLSSDYRVESDKVIEITGLPDTFPLEETFRKS